MTPHTTRKCLIGFTLVEMLVAVAVLGVLAVLLAEIANRASAAWMRGEAQASRSQSVRALMGFFATDLRSAVRPLNPGDSEGFQFIVNPPTVSAQFKNHDAVFWPSAVSRSANGDVGVVGYFVQWTAADDRPVAQLCRLFVEPADTNGNANGNFQLYSNPSAWVTDAIISAGAPATEAENFSGLLADHVVGLWVRCHDQDGNEIPNFDSRVQQRFPTQVEVSLVILDTRAAARMDESTAAAIRSVVQSSESAGDFLANVQSSSTLSALRGHLVPYESSFHLDAAP